MGDLKPCPCGKTPEKLCIAEGSTFRWRYICGDCGCGWEAEVRVPTIGDTSEEAVYESCVWDWNALPRGGDRITELEAQLAEMRDERKRCREEIGSLTDQIAEARAKNSALVDALKAIYTAT